MTAKKLPPCPYCIGQGLIVTPRRIAGDGLDAQPVKPDTVRVECSNGHKYSVLE